MKRHASSGLLAPGKRLRLLEKAPNEVEKEPHTVLERNEGRQDAAGATLPAPAPAPPLASLKPETAYPSASLLLPGRPLDTRGGSPGPLDTSILTTAYPPVSPPNTAGVRSPPSHLFNNPLALALRRSVEGTLFRLRSWSHSAQTAPRTPRASTSPIAPACIRLRRCRHFSTCQISRLRV